MTTAHDLLQEPILSWRDQRRGRGVTTLPGLLARLGSQDLGDFPRVRAHQFHPWCMFLAQLAAIALHRAERTDSHAPEEDWRRMLLALTDGAHEPWSLIVEDLEKPAFFQPPIPESKASWRLEHEWPHVDRPDDIDVLITSRGHDVKEGRLASVPELWVYALTTLQTTQGYPGRGYSPVARMKSGYGNRPRVGFSMKEDVSSRFIRDVAVLLDAWPESLSRGYAESGVSLAWLPSWNGLSSLRFRDLAPHFIEVCRRVRCWKSDDGIRCSYTTGTARRSLPDVEDGDVGDVWIPIERTGGALTVGRRGFHYDLMSSLLVQDEYAPCAAQKLRADDGEEIYFAGAALARGQGKTDGIHERSLHLPADVRRRLWDVDQRTKLQARARRHVERAKEMARMVLYPSLKELALGERIMPDTFDARVDEVFFPALFRGLDQNDGDAQLAWEQELADVARGELARAVDRCCLADARRYRAISAAESRFDFQLRKVFPDLVSTASEERPGVGS